MKHYFLSAMLALITAGALSSASAAITPPYSSDFNPADGWTIINANGDFSQWTYDTDASNWSSSTTGCTAGIIYEYDEDNDADDWAISPAIHLEAGTQYKISHWTKAADTGSCVEKCQLYYGIISGPDAYKSLQDPEKLIWDGEGRKNIYNTFKITESFITPEVTGDYYFGYHCTSPADQWNLNLTGFSISSFATHPGAATNVKIASGDMGALEATLSWNWPEVADTGEEYTGTLLGAKIYRSLTKDFVASDDNFVTDYTPSDITPGNAASFTDNTVPYAETWYYRVLPFDANGASTAASTIVNSWIGSDIPKSINKPSVSIDQNDITKVSVTILKPVGNGTHNKYVDLSQVYYQISRKNSKGQQTMLYNAWQDNTPIIDILPELDSYSYVVKCVDAKGSPLGTASAESDKVIAGGYLAFPYENGFEETSNINLFTTYSNSTSYYWRVNADREWLQCNHPSGITGATEQWLFSPPMYLESGKTYTISFDLKAYSDTAGNEGNLKILLAKQNNRDAMKAGTTVIDITNINWLEWQPEEGTFSVESDGAYYLGFWDCSTASKASQIHLDNLVIDVAESSSDKSVSVTEDDPYNADFSKAEEEWTFNASEQGNWSVKQDETTGTSYLLSTAYGSEATSPAFSLKNGLFKFSYEVSGNDKKNDRLAIYLVGDAFGPNRIAPSRNVNDNRLLIADLDLNSPNHVNSSTILEIPDAGIYNIVFRASPDETSDGVRLHSMSLVVDDNVQTGIQSVDAAGNLFYNKADQTINVPTAGHLEIFSVNGMRILNADVESLISISNIQSGTYVARFIDKEGNAHTIKFVK